MKTVRVTPAMAKRILRWLEQVGIETYDDALTVEDLVDAAVNDAVVVVALPPVKGVH